jgi:hypothetical protein
MQDHIKSIFEGVFLIIDGEISFISCGSTGNKKKEQEPH